LMPYGQTGAYSEPGRSQAMQAAIDWFNQYV